MTQKDRQIGGPSKIYDNWLSLQNAACLAQRQSARGAAMTLRKTKALTPSGILRQSASQLKASYTSSFRPHAAHT